CIGVTPSATRSGAGRRGPCPGGRTLPTALAHPRLRARGSWRAIAFAVSVAAMAFWRPSVALRARRPPGPGRFSPRRFSPDPSGPLTCSAHGLQTPVVSRRATRPTRLVRYFVEGVIVIGAQKTQRQDGNYHDQQDHSDQKDQDLGDHCTI